MIPKSLGVLMKLFIKFPVVLTEPGIIVEIKSSERRFLEELLEIIHAHENIDLKTAFYEKDELYKMILVISNKDSETLERDVNYMIEELKSRVPEIEHQMFKYEKFGEFYLCKEPIRILLRNEPGFMMRYRYARDIFEVLTSAFGETINEAIYLIFRNVGLELGEYYGNRLVNEPVEKLVEFVLTGSAFVGWVPRIKSLKSTRKNEITVEFDEEEVKKIIQSIIGADEEIAGVTFLSIARGLIDGFLEALGYGSRSRFGKKLSITVTYSKMQQSRRIY